MKRLLCTLGFILLSSSCLCATVSAANTYSNGEAVVSGVLVQVQDQELQWKVRDEGATGWCRGCGGAFGSNSYMYQEVGFAPKSGFSITGVVAMVDGKFVTASTASMQSYADAKGTGNWEQLSNSTYEHTCSSDGSNYSCTYRVRSYRPLYQIPVNVTAWNKQLSYPGNGKLTLKNAQSSGFTIKTGNIETVIDGGTYSGSPAVSGSNITVKRGTFTDRRILYMETRVCIVLLAIFLIFILLRLLSNKIDSLDPGFLEFTAPLKTTEFFKANKKPKVVKPWASQLERYRHRNPVRYSRPSQFDHRLLPRPP